VTGPYVAKVEAGRANLTVGQLANFAMALGTGLEIVLPIPEPAGISVPASPTVSLDLMDS
jgi:hypothetical protein